jgi:hypothetical protein
MFFVPFKVRLCEFPALIARGILGMNQSGNQTGNQAGDQIIEINRRGVFSLQEAQELLPVVFRITKTYSQKVEALIARLDGLSGASYDSRASDDLANALESQVNTLILEWQNKMQKLGAMPKGLWIADFDSGDGYFCWKYPESGIQYWHKYSDGFTKRIHVSERVHLVTQPKPIRKKVLSPVPMTLQPSEIT